MPDDECKCLAVLRILRTERTTEFDIFPGLASKLFGPPISAISLIDKDRQWFKASVGLASRKRRKTPHSAPMPSCIPTRSCVSRTRQRMRNRFCPELANVKLWTE